VAPRDGPRGARRALLFKGHPTLSKVGVNCVYIAGPAAVLEERRKHLRAFGAQNEKGWLGVYPRTVAPVHLGAVLNK
jgi:hypothetical protein